MIVPQLPELAQFAATICGEIAATGGDAYNLGRNPQLIKLVMGVLGWDITRALLFVLRTDDHSLSCSDLATSIPKPSWVTQFNATMPWVYQLLQWLHLVEQAEGVDPSLSLVNWAASVCTVPVLFGFLCTQVFFSPFSVVAPMNSHMRTNLVTQPVITLLHLISCLLVRLFSSHSVVGDALSHKKTTQNRA